MKKSARVSRAWRKGGSAAVVAQTLRYLAAKIDGIKVDPYALERPSFATKFIKSGEFRIENIETILRFVVADEKARSNTVKSICKERLAVLVHAYYPELITEILQRCSAFECEITFFVSTDSDEKAEIIEKSLDSYRYKYELRKFQNRGRDIFPKFFGLADVYDRFELVLHLHTKRSPHGGSALSGWREHLLDHLIGSRLVANRNLALLLDGAGVVYPDHFPGVRPNISWGPNRKIAEELASHAGTSILNTEKIEFPSGSMFFARSTALRPIINLGLSQERFEPEQGQLDGTLAHAIERLVLLSSHAADMPHVCVPDLVSAIRLIRDEQAMSSGITVT